MFRRPIWLDAFFIWFAQRLRDGSAERPLDHQQPKLVVLLMQRQRQINVGKPRR
jgi:hypothetical protein